MPKNRAPVAILGTPVITGNTVQVDGSASHDPDGTIKRWKISWGDGEEESGDGGPGVAEHTYGEAGTYDVILLVQDNKNAKTSTTVAVTIAAGPVPVDCLLSDKEYAGDWAPVGEWSQCENGSQSRVEERPWTKTVVVEPENGGAACGPTSGVDSRTVTQPCGEPPAAGALSPTDFTYLGMARVPIGLNGGGMLTARLAADGSVASFLSSTGSEELYEFGVPTAYSFEPTTAQRVALIKNHGYFSWNLNQPGACDVQDTAGCWQNMNRSWDDQGVRRNVPFHTHGIALKGDVLYRVFLDFYNSAYGATDYVLGATDLRPGQSPSTGWAKAPWRVANSNVKVIGGNLLDTPDGLGMVESFGAISRNTDNSHGPALAVMPYPSITTPGGLGSAPLSVTQKMGYSIGNKAPRINDFQPDYSNPFNPDEPGKWTQVDRAAVGVYIATTSGKRGYLVHAGLGTGQIWYGHYDEGPNGARDLCRSSTRGENAEGYRPEWRIYDPTQLTGGGHVNAAHTFDPRTLTNGVEFDWLPCKQYVTGGFFDRVKGLLYLIGGYEPGTASVPLLHVFRVN